MTLREYIQALKSWLPPTGLVLGLLCAAAFTFVATPKYAADTTLFVSTQGLQNDASRAYQGNLLSAEKVKTYTELIMSDRIRMQASNRLGTQIEPGQIVAT
ncbi:MAG: Wzz/FepE/Etk N-terminal domain-containing protein, partial [Pseudonocardiaceae bacterium]